MTMPGRPGAEVARRDGVARPSASRRPFFAGAGLGLVTFLAYLPGLGRSLDFDSAQTVGMFVKTGPPWNAFRLQAAFNNHPLFSFLEQLVRVVTGRTDAATMRLLPILFGALAVGALTWFTARRHGLAAGMVAGGLLACNPTFAGLSRSTRGYSLLVLCAIVATILVAEDRPGRSRGADLAYVAFAGMGLATHLYMFPVVVAHLGAVAGRGQLNARWRLRFGGAVAVAALAYAGLAASMIHTMGSYSRVLKTDLPWSVAVMATGGGLASVAVAPLVVAGAVLVLRRSRATRVAAIALAGVLLVQWAGLQSSALTARFFVWLVPGAAYLAAVAVGRTRVGALLAAASAAFAGLTMLPTFTDDPTAYRHAAALIRQAGAMGERSCVANIGVPPMLAYLDSPADFVAVTDPDHLDRCDLLVVSAWGPATAEWYARDRAVIAEAERRFPHRLVLAHGDPTLVLSHRPLVEAPATRPA
ncbi:MAG TPA: glycosyltransferase family 39 protein [Acidimicrobiales bacterium]|nr:glycosyltransferase family 39 protein [Acidimicrobiales bacterium]